jgi:hypothetical protein
MLSGEFEWQVFIVIVRLATIVVMVTVLLATVSWAFGAGPRPTRRQDDSVPASRSECDISEARLGSSHISISIVSAQHGDEMASSAPEYAISGTEVTLYAVAEIRLPGQRGPLLHYTLAPRIKVNGRRVATSDLCRPEALPEGLVALKWFKLEPSIVSHGNRNEHLGWARTEWGDEWVRRADVHPTLFPDQFKSVPDGLGVMRYQVQATFSGVSKVVSSPGLQEKSRLGISKKATKVTFIPDLKGWLGHLFALVNTPYIWGNYAHYADDQWGSDCADFIVAAWRRHGKKVEYTNSYGLRGRKYSQRGEAIKVGSVDDAHFYVDSSGSRIPIGPDNVQVGDVVFWPRHVGVLLKDACIEGKTELLSPCTGNGFLDQSDLVIHTLFKPPTVEGIDEAYGTPEEILKPLW